MLQEVWHKPRTHVGLFEKDAPAIVLERQTSQALQMAWCGALNMTRPATYYKILSEFTARFDWNSLKAFVGSVVGARSHDQVHKLPLESESCTTGKGPPCTHTHAGDPSKHDALQHSPTRKLETTTCKDPRQPKAAVNAAQ